MEDKDKNSAPLNACLFDSEPQVINFQEGEKPEEKTFSIVAYSGGIIPNHWFWGNVAFDLEGVIFDKPVTPVLDSHVRSHRMGFTTKQNTKGKISVEGKFLSNPKALELQNDIEEGFPIQASPSLRPDEVEFVEEGEKTEVNGLTLKGPGAVFRKARIKDISFCTFGADNQTAGKVFNKEDNNKVKFNIFRKGKIMAESKTKDKLTAETFAAEHPDIFSQVQAEAKAAGEKAQLDRFGEIAGACGGDHELAASLFAEGKDKTEALSARNEKLAEQLKESQEAVKLAAKEKVDPAAAEFSDDASKTENKDNKPKTPEEKFTEEFNASKEVQDEFGGAEGVRDYIAFRKAEDAGLTKVKK